jgi:hypothetical protein
MGELTIRKMGHISDVDLAVVFESQEGWTRTLAVELTAFVLGNDRTTRRHWTRRRAPTSGALGLIERHQPKEM